MNKKDIFELMLAGIGLFIVVFCAFIGACFAYICLLKEMGLI